MTLLCSSFWLGGSCPSGVGQETTATSQHPVDLAALQPKVAAFCGDCHATPPASSFPRDAWYEEVERGYEFYFKSGRSDLQPPPMIDIVTYYRSAAPDELRLPASSASVSELSRRFQTEQVDVLDGGQVPATAHVRLVPLAGHGTAGPAATQLLYCDVRSGELREVALSTPRGTPRTLARLVNPCRVEPCDLDGDGRQEWIIADLGSFYPADHDWGRVVWLREGEDRREATQQVLLEKVGRVADVQPADIDGDGRQELLVAVFGWQRTGAILALKSQPSAETMRFTPTTLDTRHGTSALRTCDLNGDGHLDFVALITQEHEAVEAFLNDGQGSFTRQVIHRAGDPGFGSSSMELVDLDRDGDLDVLYTNGDSFDSMYLKPYHGVQWLENEGEYPFRMHRLIDLPGAYQVVAGDMDGDGDLDLVVSSFVPRSRLANARGDEDSVLILERQEKGTYRAHRLESGQPRHATLLVADLDRDGDLDIAAGNYASSTAESRSRLTIWWNNP